MKKLLLILLCLPFIGFGQLIDFGFEGPIPSGICEGDSARLALFSSFINQIDTPYTITYSINGVMQTSIINNQNEFYINQPGQYIIHSWLNSSGTYNSSNSSLPFPDITNPPWPNAGILSVSNYMTTSQNYSICQGDSVNVANSFYFSNGNYVDTIFCEVFYTNINVEQFTSNILGLSNVSHLQIESYTVAQNINSTYTWHLVQGGNIINGINSNIVEIQWGNNSGIYELYAVETNQNGCTDTSFIDVIVGNSTEIQEHYIEKELLKVTGLLGRETKQTNQPLFYIYDDGTVEKRIVIE